MKKFSKILIAAILGIFLVTWSAWAGPLSWAVPLFSSTGYINPNYNNSWDRDTFTGTALFQLYIDTEGVEVISVGLGFENDIFNCSLIYPSDFTVLSGSNFASSSNDPIEILFNYTLLDADRYYQDSGAKWEWNNGQAWGISYFLMGRTASDYISFSLGSTTPAPVPEPATMLLLGAGLIGLAGASRKKIFKA